MLTLLLTGNCNTKQGTCVSVQELDHESFCDCIKIIQVTVCLLPEFKGAEFTNSQADT